jgi:glycosyltransferase involved in cell wall biosynthesis
MRIGIDARFLTHPQLGGFKTYTVNLINALSKIESDHLYIIYLDRKESENTSLPQAKNFQYRVIPATFPILGMPFREQVLLNIQMRKDKLDICHFLCNTAPLKISVKSVLSLLDVIQVETTQNFLTTRKLENFRRWAITEYSKWTIIKTANKVDKLITLSQFEKSEIVKHLNVPPERIHVTYFGVNPVFTQLNASVKSNLISEMREILNLPERFILGVGYEPRKNIPLLMRSFSKIAPNHPDLNLVIVAAEKERRLFFQQLASDLELSNRIFILGAVQPNELATLYNLAEVFVFPSERESFGAPPLEAIACGTPTIAMNMTSLPEILEDGALLIDGNDVDTWANAIEKVLSDNSLRADMIRFGLERATELTWENCAKETIRVYDQLASYE